MAAPVMSLRDDGIVDVEFRTDSDLDVPTLKALHALRMEMAPGPRAAMWRIAGQWPTGPATRKFAAGTQVAEDLLAVAFVGGWAGNRTLIELFMLEARPPYPVQYFDSEHTALAWLHTFLGSE